MLINHLKEYFPTAIIVLLLLNFQAANASYDDGPYRFIKNNQLITHTIVDGQLKTVTQAITPELESLYSQFELQKSTYQTQGKIAAISDIHGQHDVFIKTLKSNNIIDDNENWSFGTGHFVITGDIFDRGPQVLESLWLVYKLEKQAKEQGGKVHYLLGNHEYMVLYGREKYLHKNYLSTAKLLNTPYKNLFDEKSVLGQWLRSKSTVIKINDSVFLHGGISKVFLSHGLDLDKTNTYFRQSIGLGKKEVKAHDIYSVLHNSDGPIWYRGYFKMYGSKAGLSDEQVDYILSELDAKRIVVGHTSQDEVLELNNGRIFAIDSSIKKGKQGEVLFIEQTDIFRGTYNGKKVPLAKTH